MIWLLRLFKQNKFFINIFPETNLQTKIQARQYSYFSRIIFSLYRVIKGFHSVPTKHRRIPKAPSTVPPITVHRLTFPPSTVHRPTVHRPTVHRPTVHRPKKYFADQISLISENWTSAVRMQLKLGRMDVIILNLFS